MQDWNDNNNNTRGTRDIEHLYKNVQEPLPHRRRPRPPPLSAAAAPQFCRGACSTDERLHTPTPTIRSRDL